MITVWYPPHKSKEVAKLILKSPREIPFVTKWRVFNCPAGKEGLKGYNLIYTERGKMEEAILELGKYFLPFSEIEGYYTKFEPLIGVSDSFNLIGMKWE